MEDNRKTFVATFSNRRDAEEMIKARGGFIEEFSVEIEEGDPNTNEATKWNKKKGYSVWY